MSRVELGRVRGTELVSGCLPADRTSSTNARRRHGRARFDIDFGIGRSAAVGRFARGSERRCDVSSPESSASTVRRPARGASMVVAEPTACRRIDRRLQIGHLPLRRVSVGAATVANMAASVQDPGRDDRGRRIAALVVGSVGANVQPSLPRGTEVEVLTHYQNHWVTGFEVDGVHDDRYLLRRRSDNTVLPAAFRTDQVRARP